jgi:hypothetical protein
MWSCYRVWCGVVCFATFQFSFSGLVAQRRVRSSSSQDCQCQAPVVFSQFPRCRFPVSAAVDCWGLPAWVCGRRAFCCCPPFSVVLLRGHVPEAAALPSSVFSGVLPRCTSAPSHRVGGVSACFRGSAVPSSFSCMSRAGMVSPSSPRGCHSCASISGGLLTLPRCPAPHQQCTGCCAAVRGRVATKGFGPRLSPCLTRLSSCSWVLARVTCFHMPHLALHRNVVPRVPTGCMLQLVRLVLGILRFRQSLGFASCVTASVVCCLLGVHSPPVVVWLRQPPVRSKSPVQKRRVAAKVCSKASSPCVVYAILDSGLGDDLPCFKASLSCAAAFLSRLHLRRASVRYVPCSPVVAVSLTSTSRRKRTVLEAGAGRGQVTWVAQRQHPPNHVVFTARPRVSTERCLSLGCAVT